MCPYPNVSSAPNALDTIPTHKQLCHKRFLLVQQVDGTITQLPLKAISCMIPSFLGHQQHIYWEKM